MGRKIVFVGPVFRCSFFLLLFFSLAFASEPKGEQVKIRIGWQTHWAVQGQIAQILKKTNILMQHGFDGQFIGRTYGPELNEIALSDGVDVIFTADQPAAALFSRTSNWIVVCRLMYNRTTIYTPVNSPIRQISDLRGKKIGLPKGAAAERIALEILEKAGIENTDVQITNLDIREQIPLIFKADKATTKWDDFDALAGFDPIPAILQEQGLVKIIGQGKVVALVLMNKKFLERSPERVEHFVSAILDAWDFYRQNVEQANVWFKIESGMKNLTHSVLRICASLEPNFAAKEKKEIRLQFTEEDLAILEQAAKFVAKSTGKQIRIRDFTLRQSLSLSKID